MLEAIGGEYGGRWSSADADTSEAPAAAVDGEPAAADEHKGNEDDGAKKADEARCG